MRRPNRARLALIAALILALVLILAPQALAAAGGGSAGFGGGGGGFGGGGGRGAGLYIVFEILFRIALLGHGLGALVLIGLVLIWLLFTRLMPRMGAFVSERESGGRAARGRTAKRQRRVELAAAEAAEDDPAFAPDAVRPAAATLFADVQTAWDSGNRARLAQLVAPELLAEWERRLDDFARRGWRNRVQLLDTPTVEYVGLTHRGDPTDDRVVVRIEAKLRDYVEDFHGNHVKRRGQLSETTKVREFWTLGKRRGHWVLVSIEQGAEGSHALDEQIVATPWSDEQAMRDEALVEGAVADAVPDGVAVADVADLQFEGDARAAALDLSLADGRFAPDLLEVAARRAAAAWAEAVDGGESGLHALASAEAVRDLLHPGDPTARTRLVVRGPTVKQIRIVGLDASAVPPTMSVEVDLSGRRYLEQRDTTAVVAGSRSRVTDFTEYWTFALAGDGADPWRIVAVGAAPVGSA